MYLCAMYLNVDSIEGYGVRITFAVEVDDDRAIESELLKIDFECHIVMLGHNIGGEDNPALCGIGDATNSVGICISTHGGRARECWKRGLQKWI